jgi:histidyl-tRNA synthetase
VGLTSDDVEIQLNSRGVIVELLASLNVAEERYDEVVRIVDKRDKFPSPAAAHQALAEIIDADKAKRVLELTHFRDLTAFADATNLHNSEGVMELKHLFSLLEKSGIAEWVKFDASIARGLAYYTGVVFEAFAKDKKLEVNRAIAGGGRYNRLLSVMGSSKEIPCIGFGFGDCVVYELLSALKRMPSDEALTEGPMFTVVPFTDEFMGDAMHIGQVLRASGKTVDVCLDPKVVKKKPNPKAAFEYANERMGSKYIAFVAPDELEKGLVKVKDLSAAQETQWAIPLGDLANFENFISVNAPLPLEKGGDAPSKSEPPCPVCGGTKKLLGDTCPLCQ